MQRANKYYIPCVLGCYKFSMFVVQTVLPLVVK